MPPAPIGAMISYEPRRGPGRRIMFLLIWVGYASLPQPASEIGVAGKRSSRTASRDASGSGCAEVPIWMERVMKYSRTWVCLSLLISPALVRAQPANSSDSAELIRALLSRVEQLEKRVAELEGRSGTPGPATPPAITAAQPAVAAPAAQAAETAAAEPNPVASAPQGHMLHGSGRPDITSSSTRLAGFSDIGSRAPDSEGSHSCCTA